MWENTPARNCFLIQAQQPEHDIFSQTEQDTARNLGQWMAFFFFSHSTLAHICLHQHSMDAEFSHRALSLSPNINYGSRLKALPCCKSCSPFLSLLPSLLPQTAPRFIQIYHSSLQQSLTSSNNSSQEIPSFLPRQQ